MRPAFILSICCIGLLLQSCSENTPKVREQGSPEQQAEVPDRNSNSTETTLLGPMINDPNDFLPFIQQVIQLDTLEVLKELCHPDQSRIRFGNAFTVCGIRTADMSDIDKFRHWFGNASVTGPIETLADTAWIPMELGDDERHPIAILEKTSKNWYFVGMEWNP